MDRKNVIINQYRGGLGNQMFQYAFGLNLEKQGKEVLTDTSWYQGENCFGEEFRLKKVFPFVLLKTDGKQVRAFNRYLTQRWLVVKAANRVLPFTSKVYWERNEFAYDMKAMHTSKAAVSGYWQCYRYVRNISQELRKQFIFRQDFSSELQDILNKIKGSNTVFLHIRGGDYIKNPKAFRLYGNICTVDYYKRAILLMKKKLYNPVFVVFTNDIKYAQSIIPGKEDMFFVSDFMNEDYEDWVDLMLMSSCKHAIIANSSFSWWGAWLIRNKDKIVAAPRKWINRRQNFDIWEPEWIKV